MWITFFLLSVCVFVLSVTFAVLLGMQRKRYRITPLHILLIGVFLADFLAIFPPYYLTVLEGNGILKSVFMVFHDTLQLFTINNDFSLILDYVTGLTEFEQNLYTIYVAFLYAFTPILTVGFGLSFFKNLSAYWKYLFSFHTNAYVFSHWNEKAAALARSIVAKDKRATIILTSRTKETEENEELCNLAMSVGSIDFVTNIVDLKLNFHSKSKKISFFFIKESPADNVEEGITTLKRYKDRRGTFLYVFSNVTAHEVILNSADQGEAIVRRVNSMQSLIHMFLYKQGIEIFKSATTLDNGEKRISIALVGFGSYGAEFLRALPWFCTQPGYKTEIHVFDPSSSNFSSFQALYPDLNYAHSPSFFADAFYSIHFHTISADSLEFTEYLQRHSFTFALVITGENDRNLRISLRLRTLLARKEEFPLIYTRISNPVLSDCCNDLYAFNGIHRYNIRLIGSIENTYSYESIIESDWQKLAQRINYQYIEEGVKDCHLADGEMDRMVMESNFRFWRNEYTYSQSISQAIHTAILAELYPSLSTVHNWWEPGWIPETGGLLDRARWISFMYAQGYSHTENRSNHLSMAHRLLPKDEAEKREFLKAF